MTIVSLYLFKCLSVGQFMDIVETNGVSFCYTKSSVTDKKVGSDDGL